MGKLYEEFNSSLESYETCSVKVSYACRIQLLTYSCSATNIAEILVQLTNQMMLDHYETFTLFSCKMTREGGLKKIWFAVGIQ
jgi:hypothetical protein